MAAKVLNLLCVVFSVLAVLFCGCDKQARKGAVKTDFTAAFEGEYRGLSVKGEVTSSRQGFLSLSLQSPETLSGARFCYQDKALSFGQSGFSASADEAVLPCDSFPSLLHEVFRAAASGSYRQEDGAYRLSVNSGACTLTTDREGYPKALAAPQCSCTLRFFDAAPLDR